MKATISLIEGQLKTLNKKKTDLEAKIKKSAQKDQAEVDKIAREIEAISAELEQIKNMAPKAK